MYQDKLKEAQQLAASDPDMAELAQEEIATLENQLTDQFAEMDRIIEASKGRGSSVWCDT
ncbi:MAG: hypothetical protein R3B69_01970 [Candidatus Paceibacterota bacterium]